MLAAFDIMLVLIAFMIMFTGLKKRWAPWRAGRSEHRSGSWTGLIGYILSHGKIMENRKRGVAHLMLFWGFLIPLLIIIFAQLEFSLPLFASRILSLLMDLLGVCLIGGTVYFLITRIMAKEAGGPDRTIFPMFLIITIALSGFLAESSRLSITNNQFIWFSPCGWLLSKAIPPSPLFMMLMIRLHLLAVLFFIAALPFTFIRHLAAAPLNIFYRKESTPGALTDIPLDKGVIGAGSVKDFSWKQLLDTEACVACGRCDDNCPAFISGKPLSPKKIIKDILEQMQIMRHGGSDALPVREDEIWSCTTCMACVAHCPIFIEPMDKVIDIRRYRVMGMGRLPLEARPMIRNLEFFGDVQGKGSSYRVDWSFDLSVPSGNSKDFDLEVLLWIGCFGAFHPRYQEVSRAMVHILRTARIPFGILGKDEMCCGDPARRMGEEDLFLALARKNIRHFKSHGVKEIVCLCPHCFNTLKNEYPRIKGYTESIVAANLKVYHASEYIIKLLRSKSISPRYPINKDITFHDPCYLGRINHLYNPPREIINALPETRLIELERHHKKSFCCGGGGGNMWLHGHPDHRMDIIRAREVLETGADLLGTACPYCLTMLDNGIKTLDAGKLPKVMDIVEILAYSI